MYVRTNVRMNGMYDDGYSVCQIDGRGDKFAYVGDTKRRKEKRVLMCSKSIQ